MKNQKLQDFLIALSLSNLLFIRSWRRLIYPSSEAYHIKLEPYPADYLGAILSVLITAGLFWGGIQLARYLNGGKTPTIAKLCFFGIFAVILNGIRLQFYEDATSTLVKLGVLILLLVPMIFVFLKWRDNLFQYAKQFILILSPFILITFSQSIIGIFSANPILEKSIENQLSAIQPKEKSLFKSRIIWIVFDDLGYLPVFEKKPPSINLPEFEKLKSESFFATKAASPAHDTVDSIPSLLTGIKSKPLNQPLGRSELIINSNEGRKKFSETPSIFSKIRAFGGHSAIVGWFHPYCRVIGKDLAACYWESGDTVNDFEKLTLFQTMTRNLIDIFPTLPFGKRLQGIIESKLQNSDAGRYAKRHYRIMDAAKSVINNPHLDLALLHLSIPHYPYLYDKDSRSFGEKTDYLHNLALSDEVLGEIRQSLEKNNLWDDSTIIVSSDHQWRIDAYKGCQLAVFCPSADELKINDGKEDPRVPFILKLKGQTESVIYDKPFNTVITHDLILAIIKGEVSTAKDVQKWLDETTGKNP